MLKTRDIIIPYISKMLKQQRILLSLTLRDLADKAGVSPSYLSRIEQGQRFPSAKVLLKIAEPLRLEKNELFKMAGYLSSKIPDDDKDTLNYHKEGRLDSYVATVLSQQPVSIQRAAIGVLSIIKHLSNLTGLEDSRGSLIKEGVK